MTIPYCRKIDQPTDSAQNTRLHKAVEEGNAAEALDLLIENADVNKKNLENYGALHMAVRKGHSSLIDLLMMYGGNVNLKGQDGYLPIHMVTNSPNKLECLEKLLKYRADINSIDGQGNNLLHLMIKWRIHEVDFIKTLLQFGSNPNYTDIGGNNCLHTLTLRGSIMGKDDFEDLLMVLLPRIIDVDAKNRNGETALYMACLYGHTLFARILLQSDADVLMHCNDNSTPFDAALREGHMGVLEEIIRDIITRERRGEDIDMRIGQGILSNATLKPLYEKINREMHYY